MNALTSAPVGEKRSEDTHTSRASAAGNDGALTIDLEDWRTALMVKESPNSCRNLSIDIDYIHHKTREILKQLSTTETIATFFVLGEIASEAPYIVEEISDKGHEIASHSHSHAPLWATERQDFEATVQRDVKAIEDACGQKPRGFRAPYFSLRRSDGWVLDILRNNGFLYDSSVFPTWTPLYGIPQAPREPYYPSLEDISKRAISKTLLELPLTVMSLCDRLPGIPVAGGFFMKVWPCEVYARMLRRVRRTGQKLVLFFHPADIDTEKVRLHGLSRGDWMVQYIGNQRGLANFKSITQQFRLTSMLNAFGEESPMQRK